MKILISNPPSEKERAKELKLIQFQYKNRHNPENLQKILDDDMSRLFYAVLTHHNIDIDKKEIEKIQVSITPIIKKHKKHFNIDRPNVLAKKLGIPYKIDYLKSAQTPSYPSGHTTQAYYLALVLSERYPKLKTILFRVAKMIESSRIDRGVHFLSDNKAGIELAHRIFNLKKDSLTKEAEESTLSLKEKKKQLEKEHNKKLTYGLLGSMTAGVSQQFTPLNIGTRLYRSPLKSDPYNFMRMDDVHKAQEFFSPKTKLNIGDTIDHARDRYNLKDDTVTTFGLPNLGVSSGSTLAHELAHARYHRNNPNAHLVSAIGGGISSASPGLAFGLGTEKGTKQNLFGNIAQFGGLVGELPLLFDEGQANYNSHKYMKKFHPETYNNLHRNDSINAFGTYVANSLPRIALPFAARSLRRRMDRKHRQKLKSLNESDVR